MIPLKPDPFYNRTAELAALDRAWKRAHTERADDVACTAGGGSGRHIITAPLLSPAASAATRAAAPLLLPGRADHGGDAAKVRLARQLLAAFPTERTTEEEIAVSWNALLRYVSQQAGARAKSAGRLALILDEFPYLVEQTPELPSILQGVVDQEGVHVPLFVILCGSQLSVMAALGNESAPLFGRFNAGIARLEPLPYYDVAEFWGELIYGVAETLLMYGVLGGTPRYHALADTTRPAAEEIVTLLMEPRRHPRKRGSLPARQRTDPRSRTLQRRTGGYCERRDAIRRHPEPYWRGARHLQFYLRTLQELGWIWRELPFGETSERRAALYQSPIRSWRSGTASWSPSRATSSSPSRIRFTRSGWHRGCRTIWGGMCLRCARSGCAGTAGSGWA